jgi:hypothetical protein
VVKVFNPVLFRSSFFVAKLQAHFRDAGAVQPIRAILMSTIPGGLVATDSIVNDPALDQILRKKFKFNS